MPIYEYRCGACEHRFEALLSSSDEKAPPCPRCGGIQVAKMLSAFAVTRGTGKTPPGPCGAGQCPCRMD